MKILLRERGWHEAAAVMEAADERSTVRTTYVEARSAIARSRRSGRSPERLLALATDELHARWPKLDIIELDEFLQLAAGRVAERFGLRAFDALHLAAALELHDPQLVVATWDDRLRAAALDAGFAVAP